MTIQRYSRGLMPADPASAPNTLDTEFLKLEASVDSIITEAASYYSTANLFFGTGLAYDTITGVLTATGPTDLDGLTDVDTSTVAPTDGQVLTYNGTTALWGPASPPAAGATNLDGLTDVDTSTVAPTNGQTLIYDGSTSLWKPGTVTSGASNLDALTDVDTTTTPPTNGQVLKYDSASSLWKPATVSTGATTLDGLTDVDTSTTAPTNGQALIYNSASGLWVPATVSSGGRVLIQEQLLTANAATVTFSGIPATYKDLKLLIECRSTEAADHEFYLRFNNDSGFSYSYYTENRFGTSSGGGAGGTVTLMRCGSMGTSAMPANVYSPNVIDIYEYSDATRHTLVDGRGFYISGQFEDRNHGNYKVAAAVNRIDLFSNGTMSFATGSRFRLFGLP